MNNQENREQSGPGFLKPAAVAAGLAGVYVGNEGRRHGQRHTAGAKLASDYLTQHKPNPVLRTTKDIKNTIADYTTKGKKYKGLGLAVMAGGTALAGYGIHGLLNRNKQPDNASYSGCSYRVVNFSIFNVI